MFRAVFYLLKNRAICVFFRFFFQANGKVLNNESDKTICIFYGIYWQLVRCNMLKFYFIKNYFVSLQKNFKRKE